MAERSARLGLRLEPAKLELWRAEAASAGVTLTAYIETCVDDALAVARTIRRNDDRERQAAAGYHAMDPFEARRRDWGRTP